LADDRATNAPTEPVTEDVLVPTLVVFEVVWIGEGVWMLEQLPRHMTPHISGHSIIIARIKGLPASSISKTSAFSLV